MGQNCCKESFSSRVNVINHTDYQGARDAIDETLWRFQDIFNSMSTGRWLEIIKQYLREELEITILQRYSTLQSGHTHSTALTSTINSVHKYIIAMELKIASHNNLAPARQRLQELDHIIPL